MSPNYRPFRALSGEALKKAQRRADNDIALHIARLRTGAIAQPPHQHRRVSDAIQYSPLAME